VEKSRQTSGMGLAKPEGRKTNEADCTRAALGEQLGGDLSMKREGAWPAERPVQARHRAGEERAARGPS